MLNTYYVLSKMLEIREIDHRAIEGRVFYASELCRDGARSKKPGKLPGREGSGSWTRWGVSWMTF